MAAYQSILLVALLFVTTASLTHGLIINGTQIATVNILGRVSCTIPGTLPISTSGGIAGLQVAIVCNNGTTNLTQVVTNSNGFFIAVVNATGILFDPTTSCSANVTLPVASCTLFPPTGILSAVPSLVGVTQSLLGATATYLFGLFRVV